MDLDKDMCPVVKIDGFAEKGKQFDLDITLPKDNRNVIYGIIKDCYKEPVCDAVVKLIEVVCECGKEERRPVSHTFTDKNGEFVFGPLCPDKFYEIQIWVDNVKHAKICATCEHEGACLKGVDIDCDKKDKCCHKEKHDWKDKCNCKDEYDYKYDYKENCDCKKEHDCKDKCDYKKEHDYKDNCDCKKEHDCKDKCDCKKEYDYKDEYDCKKEHDCKEECEYKDKCHCKEEKQECMEKCDCKKDKNECMEKCDCKKEEKKGCMEKCDHKGKCDSRPFYYR